MNIKRIITTALVGISMMMTFTSCAVPVEAQVEAPCPSVEVILSNGVPYYMDNAIVYWSYGGSYWYPYYRNGHRYFRQYAHPLRHHHLARPHYRHHSVAPHHQRPIVRHRPHGHHQRPHVGPPGGHRGNFGGRR